MATSREYDAQRERVRNLLNARAPGLDVQFEDTGKPHILTFGVYDPVNDLFVIESAEEEVQSVATRSDDDLWARLQKISHDRL
jgi:hypothetical protein